MVIIENKNGVIIDDNFSIGGHYTASNATCRCGEKLIVAPAGFQAPHKPGDPVMVCRDHGAHFYQFADLIIGRQPVINCKEINGAWIDENKVVLGRHTQ